MSFAEPIDSRVTSVTRRHLLKALAAVGISSEVFQRAVVAS